MKEVPFVRTIIVERTKLPKIYDSEFESKGKAVLIFSAF
jgi:hypothetical protein